MATLLEGKLTKLNSGRQLSGELSQPVHTGVGGDRADRRPACRGHGLVRGGDRIGQEQWFHSARGVGVRTGGAVLCDARMRHIGYAYLRNARDGYLRWGAEGKVRQFDEIDSQLRDEITATHSPTAIVKTVERLDLATVGKVRKRYR